MEPDEPDEEGSNPEGWLHGQAAAQRTGGPAGATPHGNEEEQAEEDPVTARARTASAVKQDRQERRAQQRRVARWAAEQAERPPPAAGWQTRPVVWSETDPEARSRVLSETGEMDAEALREGLPEERRQMAAASPQRGSPQAGEAAAERRGGTAGKQQAAALERSEPRSRHEIFDEMERKGLLPRVPAPEPGLQPSRAIQVLLDIDATPPTEEDRNTMHRLGQKMRPIVSLGEYLRPIRPKISEFTYRKVGAEPPPPYDTKGFYSDQLEGLLGPRETLEDRPGHLRKLRRNEKPHLYWKYAPRDWSKPEGGLDVPLQLDSRGRLPFYSQLKRRGAAAPAPPPAKRRRRDEAEEAGPPERPKDAAASPARQMANMQSAVDYALEFAKVIEKQVGAGMDFNQDTLQTVQEKIQKLLHNIEEQGLVPGGVDLSSQSYAYDMRHKRFRTAFDTQHAIACLKRIAETLKAHLAIRKSEAANLRRGPSDEPDVPIIMVPGSLTSCINIWNARRFLGEGVWEVAGGHQDEGDTATLQSDGVLMEVNRPGCPFHRWLLKTDPASLKPEDWQRVCAVLVTGELWELRNFFPPPADQPAAAGKPTEPRDVFDRIQGFHVAYEDQQLPAIIGKWRLEVLRVSKLKTKRHKDLAVVEAFWRILLARMSYMPYFRAQFKGK
eukprot:TRINITY_DN13071_c0_g1_i1.p1 TRINITY_DN13071_c0_g1~~TRINITY_DN13071_c0_g1_i1.p1  ORF type:complete len:699 (+),score=178.19 TRINITY_DN13071_c0_g1_i1:94-2097(+)